MRQATLLEAVMRMNPGQAIRLGYEDMREAAEGSIKSLLFDGPARRSDIAKFVLQIEGNWQVRVSHDMLKDEWTIFKAPGDKQ